MLAQLQGAQRPSEASYSALPMLSEYPSPAACQQAGSQSFRSQLASRACRILSATASFARAELKPDRSSCCEESHPCLFPSKDRTELRAAPICVGKVFLVPFLRVQPARGFSAVMGQISSISLKCIVWRYLHRTAASATTNRRLALATGQLSAMEASRHRSNAKRASSIHPTCRMARNSDSSPSQSCLKGSKHGNRQEEPTYGLTVCFVLRLYSSRAKNNMKELCKGIVPQVATGGRAMLAQPPKGQLRGGC